MAANPNTRIDMPVGGVAGLFHNESDAEQAIEELKSAGFTHSEIGIATPGPGEGKPTGFWSKVKGLFGGEEHTENAEDFQQSLENSGLPSYEAQHFNRSLAEGDILVMVRATGDRAERARNILRSAGADIGAGAGTATGTTTSPKPVQAIGERRIQLVGEVLRVHKERVGRGEVRLRKEVVTENQNLEVPVSREELVIERVSGQGREATGQVGAGDKEIRVPLSEEQVRVEKKPVVNEEVRVGKREVQDTKRISDTVRHEELRGEGDVEQEKLRDIKDKNKKIA